MERGGPRGSPPGSMALVTFLQADALDGPPGTQICDYCERVPAQIWCTGCEIFYCEADMRTTHKKNRAPSHVSFAFGGPQPRCRMRGCAYVCSSLKEMLAHRNTHAQFLPGDDGKFHCGTVGCGYATPYKPNLKRHVRTHERKGRGKVHRCEKCKLTFPDAKTSRQHRQAEHGQACTFPGCAHVALDRSDLAKHRVTHLKQKPFACSFHGCTYRCGQRGVLYRHNKTHKKTKKLLGRGENDDDDDDDDDVIKEEEMERPSAFVPPRLLLEEEDRIVASDEQAVDEESDDDVIVDEEVSPPAPPRSPELMDSSPREVSLTGRLDSLSAWHLDLPATSMDFFILNSASRSGLLGDGEGASHSTLIEGLRAVRGVSDPHTTPSRHSLRREEATRREREADREAVEPARKRRRVPLIHVGPIPEVRRREQAVQAAGEACEVELWELLRGDGRR